MVQALLQRHKATHTPISILERVNVLKFGMQGYHIIHGDGVFCVVFRQKFSHLGRYVLWLDGLQAADHVGPALVIADREPAERGIFRIMLKDIMKMLDDVLRQFLLRNVNHIIDCAKMMNRFQNVIDRHTVAYINGVSLENQPRLLLRELATFDVVGVVGHTNLKLMVKPAGYPRVLLVSKDLENRIRRNLSAQAVRIASQIVSNLTKSPCRQLLALGKLGDCPRRYSEFCSQVFLLQPLSLKLCLQSII